MATILRAPASMVNPTIERFMTKTPHTIGHRQTLAAAHRLMNDHGIRHLPVLDSGKLVGILSQHDLHLIETLRDVKPEEVEVNEAMTPTPFTVSARASLRKVASEMAAHKYGSAVVMEKDRVVGVFTTIDALRALCALLAEERPASPGRR
jgi:acetoin utilization protein AcuB